MAHFHANHATLIFIDPGPLLGMLIYKCDLCTTCVIAYHKRRTCAGNLPQLSLGGENKLWYLNGQLYLPTRTCITYYMMSIPARPSRPNRSTKPHAILCIRCLSPPRLVIIVNFTHGSQNICTYFTNHLATSVRKKNCAFACACSNQKKNICTTALASPLHYPIKLSFNFFPLKQYH